MAWLDGYSKRIKLTVDNTNVDGTLTDFPVLIKISDSSGINSTDVTSVFTELGSDANRKKIAVTTSDGGTQCYVEIERFDYSNSVAWLWVKVPSVVSGAETILFLYYDSSQPDNTTYIGDIGDTPAQLVWDGSFKAVYHMTQDPNGDVADAIKDSTSNANHGTPAGAMTSANLVDGKIGKAIEFDGINDYILQSSGNPISITSGQGLSVMAIIKTVDTVGCIVSLRNSGDGDPVFDFPIGYNGAAGADGHINPIVRYDNNTGLVYFTSSVAVNDGNWHFVGVVLDQDGDTFKTYIDNSVYSLAQTTNGAITATSDRTSIGIEKYSNINYLAGIIEEVRISNTARSAAWIKATYYSNWDELVSFGSEETEAVNYISGYVKEGTVPVNRQIYLHNRDTGELITSTTSSGAGGYFYMETTYSGAHYVVCLDDVIGVNYNDLIYGQIFPATISG